MVQERDGTNRLWSSLEKGMSMRVSQPQVRSISGLRVLFRSILSLWTVATFVTMTLLPTVTKAHIGIAPKAVNDMFDGRDYEEGTSQFIEVLLPHDCSNDAGDHFPTQHVAVMIPNGTNIDPSVSVTVDDQGNPQGANVMMESKAGVNANWQEVRVLKGTVAPFYSGGIKTEDVRAFHWMGGLVDNDHYERLQIRATLPMLTGCSTSLRVFVPAVQYCTEGYKIAWIREETPLFQADEKTEVTAPPSADPYVASFIVKRNLETNPLPADCEAGIEAEGPYPTAAEIDQYLVIPEAMP
jgi:hypothetical protein